MQMLHIIALYFYCIVSITKLLEEQTEKKQKTTMNKTRKSNIPREWVTLQQITSLDGAAHIWGFNMKVQVSCKLSPLHWTYLGKWPS